VYGGCTQAQFKENSTIAFKDIDRDLGQHVQFATNTKGTERKGVPSAIAEMGKTEAAKAASDPTKLTTVGTAVRGLRDL
jgi:hypothetical protein